MFSCNRNQHLVQWYSVQHMYCHVNYIINQQIINILPCENACNERHVWIRIVDPWASYQIRKIAGCACARNAGNVFPHCRFQRKPLVSDPAMHHGTFVTHMPWCMAGSLTCGDVENVPGSRLMRTRNFAYLARSPWPSYFRLLLPSNPRYKTAMLHLHLHSWLHTWLQWIEQSHLQSETRII